MMFQLYKDLKEAGFPQGGGGLFLLNPDTDEKVYKPLPGEIFSQFISDPPGWDLMSEAMAKVWIEQNRK